MNRLLLLTAMASGLLGSATGQAEQPSSARGATALDLRSLNPREARVGRVPGPVGAVRVTFQPAEWPSVRLSAPRDRAWDWSAWGFLLLELNNPETREIALGIRIDDDPAADGRTHCRTAQVKLQAGEAATLAVALKGSDPMAYGMRGLPSYPGTRNVTTLGVEPFDLGHIVEFQIFLHQSTLPRSLEIRSARLEPGLSLAGIVDPLGQYTKVDWPGKVQSESDLVHSHESEAVDLEAHPAPRDRDRFGGWQGGPRQEATGFFRTKRLDGKWWLVDPDGALFISLGIDVVTPNEATIITGRESMFTALPQHGEPMARYFGTARRIHSGPVKEGKTFNFYAANLERTFGPNPEKHWTDTTLSRLRSWGFNTIGNWSDPRLY